MTNNPVHECFVFLASPFERNISKNKYIHIIYIVLTVCLLIGEEPPVYFESKRNLQISFKLSASR